MWGRSAGDSSNSPASSDSSDAPAAATSITTAASGVTAPPAATAITSATAKPAAPTPKTGGILKQAYPLEVVSLDPMLKVQNDFAWIGVFDRLTAYDDQLKPQPMLAESWEISTDAKQVKLNLRKGVQFHSGREMTSDDVKYSLQRAANPKVAAAQYTGMASWFSGVDTPDKYTAIFKSDLPRPTIFDLLEFLNICDKDTLEGPDAKNTAVGTGPFKFVEWIPGDHVTLTKNANYWQTGKPYLDGIQIPILRDQQAMTTQLEAGALDIARLPNLVDFNRLKTEPEVPGVAGSADGCALRGWLQPHHAAVRQQEAAPGAELRRRQAALRRYDPGRRRRGRVAAVAAGVGRPTSLPSKTSTRSIWTRRSRCWPSRV